MLKVRRGQIFLGYPLVSYSCLFVLKGMIQMLATRPVTDIPPFNNIQNEIFDMVKPAHAMRIGLKDLINWLVYSFLI